MPLSRLENRTVHVLLRFGLADFMLSDPQRALWSPPKGYFPPVFRSWMSPCLQPGTLFAHTGNDWDKWAQTPPLIPCSSRSHGCMQGRQGAAAFSETRHDLRVDEWRWRWAAHTCGG